MTQLPRPRLDTHPGGGAAHPALPVMGYLAWFHAPECSTTALPML